MIWLSLLLALACVAPKRYPDALDLLRVGAIGASEDGVTVLTEEYLRYVRCSLRERHCDVSSLLPQAIPVPPTGTGDFHLLESDNFGAHRLAVASADSWVWLSPGCHGGSSDYFTPAIAAAGDSTLFAGECTLDARTLCVFRLNSRGDVLSEDHTSLPGGCNGTSIAASTREWLVTTVMFTGTVRAEGTATAPQEWRAPTGCRYLRATAAMGEDGGAEVIFLRSCGDEASWKQGMGIRDSHGRERRRGEGASRKRTIGVLVGAGETAGTVRVIDCGGCRYWRAGRFQGGHWVVVGAPGAVRLWIFQFGRWRLAPRPMLVDTVPLGLADDGAATVMVYRSATMLYWRSLGALDAWQQIPIEAKPTSSPGSPVAR